MKTRKMKRLSYRKMKKINNNKYLKTNKYVKKTKKQIKNKTRKNKTRKNMIHKRMIHKRMIHKRMTHKRMIDKIEGGGGKYTYIAPWYTKKKIEKIKKINAYENIKENHNKTLVMAEDLEVGKYYRFLDNSENNVNIIIKDDYSNDFIKLNSHNKQENIVDIEDIQKKNILELSSKTNENSLYDLSFSYGKEIFYFTVSPYYVFELVTIFAKDLVVGQEYMLLDDDVINKENDIIIRDTTSMENKKKENILHYLKKYKVKLLNKKKEKKNYELNFKKESIQIDITVSPNYVFQIPQKEKGESYTEAVPAVATTEEEVAEEEESDTAVVPAVESAPSALPLSPREQRLLKVKQKRANKKKYEEEELNSALESLDEALAEYST